MRRPDGALLFLTFAEAGSATSHADKDHPNLATFHCGARGNRTEADVMPGCAGTSHNWGSAPVLTTGAQGAALQCAAR